MSPPTKTSSSGVVASPAPSQQFDWQYYLDRSGTAGAQWMQEFRQPRHAHLAEQLNEALRLLHNRNPAPALEKLAAADAILQDFPATRPSILQVFRRMYHGVMGYYLYCTRSFETAGEELWNADRCVRQAVECDRVLLPMAVDCVEFRLHHARIARNQRQWRTMRERIEDAKEMIENRLPLCTLADGTDVDYELLSQHFRSLPLEPEAKEGLVPILDIERRRELFERFIMQIYLLPGYVTPYS